MPQLRACALLLALAATSSWPGAGAIRRGRHTTTKREAEAAQVSSDRVAGRRRRRRRTCGEFLTDFPLRKAETVGCSSSVIGSCDVPKYYTIVRDDAAQRVSLGTHLSREAAQRVYDVSNWQVRVLLDETQTVMDRQDNCGNSNEFQDWAVGQLTTVDYCDYPSSKWDLVFAVLNPRSDYTRTESTLVGRSFTTTTTLTYKVKFSSSVGIGPFKSSIKYSVVSSFASSETWENAYNVTEAFTVKAGVPVAKWKYVLTSKCFNKVGQFLDEVSYATNIFCDTDDVNTQPPDDALQCPTGVAAVGNDFVPLRSSEAGSG